MITASELAGFFAAHAIWSVSDGATLIPILGYTTEAGERKMERIVSDEMAKAVEMGRGRMEENAMDAIDAVLLFDARIPGDGGKKLDAIIIEARAYFSPMSRMTIAVPYTPADGGRFLVHRPKLLEWEDCEDFDQSAALTAFFEGVDSHEQGSKVWKEGLDESK